MLIQLKLLGECHVAGSGRCSSLEHPVTLCLIITLSLRLMEANCTSPGTSRCGLRRHACLVPCLLTHGLLSRSVEIGWSHHQAGVTQDYVGDLGLPSPFPESPRGHQVEHAHAPTHSLWSLFFRRRFPQICLPPSGPDLQMELGVLELFTSLRF